MNVGTENPPLILGNVSSPPKELRAAILFYRFGPYHHARLKAAGQQMSVWGIEACAQENIYAWAKVEGESSFTRVTLTEYGSGDWRWKFELRRKMRMALSQIKPHVVVIPGWSLPDALSALEWCAETNTPMVVMSESTSWDEPRVAWKEWTKSRLIRLCSAGLAGGTPHAEYLAQLGLPRGSIFLGYDIVDNDYFANASEAARSRDPEFRKAAGLPQQYFLASARFIEKKNLPRLLKAYAQYRQLAAANAEARSATPWSLVLVGDGPLRSSILDLRSSLGLDNCVHLPGFVQYEKLPAYYGLASAFVHASTTEQWGLVVNEAMASGLPVLVSNRCGCAHDLVQEAVNGFTFDPDNVDVLAALMQKISAPDFPLLEFGSESRRIIANWGPNRFANGVHNAVTEALKAGLRRTAFLDRLVLGALLRYSYFKPQASDS